MESYIVITAAHLTRSADLKLAQMDQQKKKGVPDDLTVRNRLGQLKTMAALAHKGVLVHLSCSDAQILTPVAIQPEPVKRVGDINIHVKTTDPAELVKAVRRHNRRLRG